MKGLLSLIGLIIFCLIYGIYPRYPKILKCIVFLGSTLLSIIIIMGMFIKYGNYIDLKTLFIAVLVIAFAMVIAEVFPKNAEAHKNRREEVAFGIDSILFINSIIIISFIFILG